MTKPAPSMSEKVTAYYRKMPATIPVTIRRSEAGFAAELHSPELHAVPSFTFQCVFREVTETMLQSMDVPPRIARYIPSYYLPIEEAVRLWNGIEADEVGRAVLVKPPELTGPEHRA